MHARRSLARRGAIAALLFAAACSPTSDPGPPTSATLRDTTVEVGSFDFLESEILAEVYSQALEAGGVLVHRSFRLGPRELVDPALAVGLVELVPEYSGTATAFFVGRGTTAHDAAASHGALRAALTGTSIVALDPAAAQDVNTFAVTCATAARLGLRRLSDIQEVAPSWTFGGPAECPSRPLCLDGLRRVYDLRFGEVVALDAGGPLTREALSAGSVDVGLLFTTDPALGDAFVALEDDRELQPAESITPLVRREVIEAVGPQVRDLVDAVSARLSTEALRALNAQVGTDPSRLALVVRGWLEAQGLR